MTTLREGLAQMGETARAATPGTWRDNDGRPVIRQGAADFAHIATFSPDVAAALVAVADAAIVEREAVLFDDRMTASVNTKAALDALAAAMGVSR